MAKTVIDEYLAGLDEAKRSSLEVVRQRIRQAVPDAEECISYRLPAFRLDGNMVAGFAAFKNHLSYLPHSGSVLPALADKLVGYERTTGSLHFPIHEPLSQELVSALIAVRLGQLELG